MTNNDISYKIDISIEDKSHDIVHKINNCSSSSNSFDKSSGNKSHHSHIHNFNIGYYSHAKRNSSTKDYSYTENNNLEILN